MLQTLARMGIRPVLALLAFAPAMATAPALPAELVPSGGAVRLDDEEPIEVSLLELTSIDYKAGKPLPSDIQDLDEELIVIEGYMAVDTGEGQSSFRLLWDACGCGASKVHHFVEVTMPEDELTEYTPELIRITGKFSVGEEKDENGLVQSLYRLKADKVEEVVEE